MHKAIQANLNQLIGFTVTGIAEDAGDPATEFDDSMPCLVLENDEGKQILAFISSDEEGNGPGHLMLEGSGTDPKISF
jgi:hypothetical protein